MDDEDDETAHDSRDGCDEDDVTESNFAAVDIVDDDAWSTTAVVDDTYHDVESIDNVDDTSGLVAYEDPLCRWQRHSPSPDALEFV